MTNNVYSQSVLTFDCQADYIDFGKKDIGGVFAQGSSAFTISGWVNPHELTNKAITYAKLTSTESGTGNREERQKGRRNHYSSFLIKSNNHSTFFS